MNFLGGHRGVFFEPYKEVFEEVDAVIGTHELICGASNYQNVLCGGCLKGVKSMVYEIIDEA